MAFRNDDPDADATANGAGKPGYTDGVPGVTAPTPARDKDLNMLQEEICNAVEGAGLILETSRDGADQNQLDQVFKLQARQNSVTRLTKVSEWSASPSAGDGRGMAIPCGSDYVIMPGRNGSNGCVHYSSDRGGTWSVHSAGLLGNGYRQAAFKKGGYAICIDHYSSGIAWSYAQDGALSSWTDVTDATPDIASVVFSNFVSGLVGGVAYFGGAYGDNTGGDLIFTYLRSDAAPATVFTQDTGEAAGTFPLTCAYGNEKWVIGNRGTDVVVADQSDVTTWATNTVGSVAVHSVVFNGTYFLAIDADGKVWRSTDGATWAEMAWVDNALSLGAGTWTMSADTNTGVVLIAEDVATAPIYASADNGATFTLVYTKTSVTGSNYGVATADPDTGNWLLSSDSASNDFLGWSV